MFKNQVQHVKLMQIISYDLVYKSHRPFKQYYRSKKCIISQKNACSKKCPNDWPFFLAHYLIIFDPNHVNQGLLESQDVIVLYINRSCC